MRGPRYSCLIALFGVVAAALAATSDPSGWQEISPSQGGFRIRMPGTATEQADPETGVHNFLVTDGEQRWVAGYLSLPPELQSIPALQLLAQAQDGFVRIMPNSKLVSSSQARVGGFPAITCVIEAQAPDRPPFKLKMSAVVAKGRLFTFGFISRKDAFVESEVNKYLETFRVK